MKVRTIDQRGLLPLEKKLILVHITRQGRTQWRIPPRFDPRFLLYFQKIVRLTATGLSISPSSKSLCLLFPPKSLLVSNLNDYWPVTALRRNCMDGKPKVDITRLIFTGPLYLHIWSIKYQPIITELLSVLRANALCTHRSRATHINVSVTLMTRSLSKECERV